GQPVLDEVSDLVTRVEGHEGLEFLDRLVELRLAIVRLAHEEARARRVGRVRVSFHDLEEGRPRLGVAPLAHLVLTDLVELLGGKDRCRRALQPAGQLAASAREEEEPDEEEPAQHRRETYHIRPGKRPDQARTRSGGPGQRSFSITIVSTHWPSS